MDRRPLPGSREKSKHLFSRRLAIGIGVVVAVTLCVLLVFYVVLGNQTP